MKKLTSLVFVILLMLFALCVNTLADGGLLQNYSVTNNVDVTYNKAKTALTINGVEYTSDDDIKLWTIDKSIIQSEIFTEEDKNGYTTVISPDIIALLDCSHLASSVDVDKSGKADALIIVPKTAYRVTSISSDASKTVTLTTLDNANVLTVSYSSLNTDVAKNDVLVVAVLDGTYYVDIVEGIETYATKLSASDNKVTLAGIGVVSYEDGVIDTTNVSKLLGSDNILIYYVYEGKLLFVELPLAEYNLAILKEIVKQNEDLNPSTMKYEVEYIATLIIDGIEKKIKLPAEGYAVIGEKSYTAAEAYVVYYTDLTPGGSPNYNYTIVSTFAESDNGEYILTIDQALNPETDTLVTGALSYDEKKGLYSIGEYNKIILDENSRIYYTYTEEKTGDFKHLGYYTKDTITEKSFLDAGILGNAYLIYNESTKVYTLMAAMINGEIKEVAEDVIDYTTDGSMIYYAYNDSSAIFNPTDKNIYYEHSFMDNETLTNKDPFVDMTQTIDKATATEEGCFYAWSENNEKYIKIDTKYGIDSFLPIKLNSMFTLNNHYLLEYNSEEMVSLKSDVKVWGLGEKNNKYVTLSLDELSNMLNIIDEYNKNNDETIVANAILVRKLNYEESTGVKLVWDVISIIVEIYTEKEDGSLSSLNGTIFGGYNPGSDDEEIPATPTKPSGALSVKNASVQQGKTVDVPISISGNEGLTGLQLEIGYDEGLELVGVTQGEALSTLELSVSGKLDSNPVRLIWDGADADTSNGEIVVLTFKAKEDLEVGNYKITVDVAMALDDDINVVEVLDTEGTISVRSFALGDANDDGEVDLKDVIVIRRYLVGGYDIEVNEAALDTNSDGIVDLKDVITLRRYIVGGYGVELN